MRRGKSASEAFAIVVAAVLGGAMLRGTLVTVGGRVT